MQRAELLQSKLKQLVHVSDVSTVHCLVIFYTTIFTVLLDDVPVRCETCRSLVFSKNIVVSVILTHSLP